MNKIIVTALWILTMLFAYWLGIVDRPVTKNSFLNTNEYPQVISGTQNEPIDEEYSMVDSVENSLSSINSYAQFQDEEEFINTEKELSDKLVESHPIERLEAFAVLLKSPNESKVETALKAYESLPSGPGRFSELKILAFAWGQVDPESALKWAKKQQHWDEHVASSSIMDSWARVDANAAIEWARENFEGEENPYFVGIINGLSESSLPRATDLMTELPYGRVRGRAAHLLFEKVWTKGEDISLHWAEHLPEGSLQNFAYGQFGEKIVREDSHRAIEWIESMEESSLKSAVIDKVAKEMARENPVETASWVNSLPAGESKITAMNQLAEMWTRKDPVATAEWINQMPSDVNKDPLIETLVNKIHKSDPQNALVWAETISNSERRKQLVEKVEKVIQSTKPSIDKTQ